MNEYMISLIERYDDSEVEPEQLDLDSLAFNIKELEVEEIDGELWVKRKDVLELIGDELIF